jgi:Nif-specific regulatory protein
VTAKYTYLTMIAGSRIGSNFLLDPTDSNRIGRGLDCDIVLADPLCSRVHAELIQEADGWWVRDAGSRNGTYVDGQKIDRIRLESGSRLRLGSTEFSFHGSNQPPTQATGRAMDLTQSIVQQAPIPTGDSEKFALAALRHADNQHDLMLLYRLSVKLLGCDDPDQVVRVALELLDERTKASVVGFLWASDERELKPKLVIPETATSEVLLSETLTDIVARQQRAVWVANKGAAANVSSAESLRPYTDAICVPMVHQEQMLGAIHLYLAHGNFRQQDFDFAISLAHILVVGLARSRRQATLKADHERLLDNSAAFGQLIGECDSIRLLKQMITRIARATGCVLIRGESGSGKELVAHAIHRLSARADRPMLCVNCASLPGPLIESQLFGHVKGAFTGAVDDRKGWFQQADTGTLFLDEIGELTREGQAKLLRILEGHPFLAVGGSREITVDVRVLAATNRDLLELVREGRFREDLYYRLTVFELVVPPLRERGNDIDLLIDHFFDHFRRQHGCPQRQMSDAARYKLRSYPWPGNVRQLRNVMDSATVMAAGDVIGPDDFGLRDAGIDRLESLRMDHWEKKLISAALKEAAGNIPEAAKLLGIGRATLYRKIDEYEIPR